MNNHQKPLSLSLALGLALAGLAFLLVGVSRAETPAEASVPALTHAASGDGEGLAVFTVTQLSAGVTDTFCLVYTATGSISTTGGIRVVDPNFHGTGWAMWQEFQTTSPATSGYLTVTTTGSADLLIDRMQSGNPQYQSYTTLVVTSGELEVGDEVTLCFVRGRIPHKSYTSIEWQTLTDGDGDGTFAPIGVSPRMSVLPAPTPVLMVATGPTYVEKGVPFTLTVRVLDEYSNPCLDFVDTLDFTSTASASLPPSGTLFSGGVREYAVTLNSLGIHYVYIDPAGPLPIINSNPLVVVESLAAQPQLFWGDLHGHHGHVYTDTHGQRVDEYMVYARDVSDLDFACESHKSSSYDNVMEVHVEVAASIDQYNEPGRFVTIRGYEWMGDGNTQGHHNYYFSSSGPITDLIYSPDDPDSDTLDEMWWLFEENLPPGEEAIGPPHALLHSPDGSGCNWDGFDEFTLNRRYRPLAEVYSHWGSSEIGPGSAREALVYGNHVGFYGSSDTHFSYPGNPQTEAWGKRGQDYVAGLAAVRASALTRPALWQGLETRYTYATEGERIFLDFTVNGYPMGSEISSTVAPSFVVTAAGTAPITEVIVFKGTYITDTANPAPTNDYYTIIYADAPNALITSFEVTDSDFDANAFYYVRVTQADGKRAWSSPVWIDYGTPEYLWARCGNRTLDPGETLVSCPADAQIPQHSWLDLTGDAPTVVVSDTAVPLIGLYVYNAENVTGHVPYTSAAWLPYMQEHVDRVISAGLSYLGFSGLSLGAYQGPAYPTALTLTNPAHWDLDNYDALFEYAAHRGVYLLPSHGVSNPPTWWVTSPMTHHEMMQIDSANDRWWTPSFNNPEYWDTADPIVEQIIKRYRDHPALLGWDVRIGQGENNYPPPYTQDLENPPQTWCDYSPYARDSFRAWLADRYDNDVWALRAAWMSDTVTFGDVEIPKPLSDISPTTWSDMILYANGDADDRPEFRDWIAFRQDEKSAETQHFVQWFSTVDPSHVVLAPLSWPLAEANPRDGRQDGERAYRTPLPDVAIYHPRIAHTDEEGFNSQRSSLYLADQYAAHSGKLTAWANEDTSEMVDESGMDQDNIWRLDSFDIMHAAMAQGDGWVTGNEGADDPANLLPSWDVTERAEMRRLAPLHTVPNLCAPRPKIAILTDDFGDGFNYPLAGGLATQLNRVTDRDNFSVNLFSNGRAYDLLTANDVISDPGQLQDYEGVLVMNLPRLTTTVALELAQYGEAGGGLFVAGVTGVMDDFGRPNSTTLQILLGITITGKITQETLIDEWQFDNMADPLVGPSLSGDVITENLYYIPTLPPNSGFTEIAHLTGSLTAPVVGYKGKTVFWFPRLTMGSDQQQIQFQENLWAFFGVPPDAVNQTGSVEATGGNYKGIFTSQAATVEVTLDDAISTTGALVWDWNQMRLVGTASSGSTPQLTFSTVATGSYFLGATPLNDAVQLVALSGGLLSQSPLNDVTARRYAVGVYRTTPGQPVTVAIYPGGRDIEDVFVSGGTLTSAQLDPSGQVYLITVWPLEERLAVTLEYGDAEKPVYLPLVLRDY